MQANLRIIEELRLFVSLVAQDSALREVFCTIPGGFTRKRKLPFEHMVLLIAKLCKKTLSVELDRFFAQATQALPCSVSAFCQQRKKLSPLFYQVWNELLLQCYYTYGKAQVKRWRGYRLIAVDGSNVSLVNTPALQEHFGGQSNQQCSFVQGKTMYWYDVLNRLVLKAQLGHYRKGELTVAYPMVDRLEQDMLAIYDRNFCNYKMVALHLWQERERKFLIRAKEGREPFCTFILSGKASEVAWLSPSPAAINGLRKSGYVIDKNTLLKVRLVRVDLPGSVEVLVTNLWEEEGHGNEVFQELYFKRWGVETNIAFQKNILQLESFSGLSPLAVEQDFHATVFVNNLYALLVANAQRTIDDAPRKGKYAMQVNGNKSYGKLREELVGLFIRNEPSAILKELHRYFIRDPLPIRPGRTFQRVVKNKQSKCKHRTFMNYKPAF